MIMPKINILTIHFYDIFKITVNLRIINLRYKLTKN